MKKSTKALIWGASAVVFTLALNIIDVKTVERTNTHVGMATVNQAVFDFMGVNPIWETVTNILIVILAAVMAAVVIWLFVKRFGAKKAESKRIAVGIASAFITAGAVLMLYFVFKNMIVVNYRPILVDGKAEASFPSLHTLGAVAFAFVEASLISKNTKNKTLRLVANTLLPTMAAMVGLGRVAAGMHWTTDVIGAVLYGMTLVSTYELLIENKYE